MKMLIPVCECGSPEVWDVAPDGTCFCRSCDGRRKKFHFEEREVSA